MMGLVNDVVVVLMGELKENCVIGYYLVEIVAYWALASDYFVFGSNVEVVLCVVV